MSPVVVIAQRLPAAICALLASIDVAATCITGRQADADTGGVLWLVDDDEAGVLAKRISGRPPGPDRIVVVSDRSMPDTTFWAADAIGADLVTVLPAGAGVIRSAVEHL